MKDRYYPHQVSYWQIGCNDARAGKPADPRLSSRWNGYDNGYYWGQHGKPMPVSEMVFPPLEPFPEPLLKNPYMEGIEAIEGILERLQTFTKEYPRTLDTEPVQDYITNLLAARDHLHECRRQEMEAA